MIGLIVPQPAGILPVLSPIAACGLMLVMAGATPRFRRSEWGLMAGNTAYRLVFALLAWGRSALAPFGGLS
ncbi:DoxX family protein [Brevibacterium permense]|uniref:DoxX family protein n=1 Tax=Brevibacterium permense TaxID=234834 RepID=UPI003CCA07B8